MLFNSLSYAVFLPLVFAVHWLLPQRYRWAALLAFSYYFYMSWNPRLVWLIGFTTLVSYASGLALQRLKAPAARKAVLALCVTACLAVLFFFKYYGFAADTVTAAAGLFGLSLHPATLNLILPVGISFYTFQTLSYAVDVYRGSMAAETHLGYYALYVSFFPQLVAGPIERADGLLRQLRAERTLQSRNVTRGLQRILIGLFKKVAIADTLAGYVDAVYNDLAGKSGLTLLLATFFFAVQIYCDFSGYSDIALGSARLLGIELMENFKSPYFALSVREFWRRWHISLTTWFTDYVYIPLGGSRCSVPRHLVNLLITFFLSGLWHGAAWHFVAWGVYHGVWLCLESFYMKKIDGLQARLHGAKYALLAALRTGYTILLAVLGWVFFRANTLADAAYVFANLCRGLNPLYLVQYAAAMGMSAKTLAVCLALIALLFLYDGIGRWRRPVLDALNDGAPAARYALYYLLCVGIFLAVIARPYGAAADFIYFQF